MSDQYKPWDIDGETTTTYTSVGIILNAVISADYGPDMAEQVGLMTCNECGAVVLEGGTLGTAIKHSRWHDEQKG